MHKKERSGLSRRRILKSSVAGAAAFGVPWLMGPRRARALRPGTTPHPEVGGLRTVGVRDPSMIDGEEVKSSWDRQEQMLRREVVEENMDRMACALAGETDPAKAWRRIFLKPPGKTWGEVVAAMKTNQNCEQHGHSAVVAKICHVLTDIMGVKGENIHLYDACHGANMTEVTPYTGLPEGVNLESRWGGYNIETEVPPPYQDGEGKLKCLDHLVKGEVDILVNVGVCRGTLYPYGAFSQCQKNHFGTFDPRPSHEEDGGGDYLVSISKAPAILGETDPKTGRVLFPREQLCVIDATWASERGPAGLPSAQSARLYMGTFGPVLDYQVATRFRRDEMGWRINPKPTRRLLEDFGFTTDDLPEGGGMIDALKTT